MINALVPSHPKRLRLRKIDFGFKKVLLRDHTPYGGKVETIVYGENFHKISWKHCKNMINCSLISTAGDVFLLKFICFCVFYN